MKKFLALLVAGLLLLTMIACSPATEESTDNNNNNNDITDEEMIFENLKYAVNDDGYFSITGYIPNGVEDVALEIPAIIDGREVTGIAANAFKASKYITSVNFKADEETGKIYIKTIGEAAFYDCDKLTTITIPATVKTIEGSAFRQCDALKSVVFAKDSTLTEIGMAAFWECRALKTISLPAALTTIGTGAFWECDSLTKVVIPSSVKTLGDSVFAGCDALADLTVPASVTTVGEGMLINCGSAVCKKQNCDEDSYNHIKITTPENSAFAKHLKDIGYTYTTDAEPQTPDEPANS